MQKITIVANETSKNKNKKKVESGEWWMLLNAFELEVENIEKRIVYGSVEKSMRFFLNKKTAQLN